jgi:predicted ATPase
VKRYILTGTPGSGKTSIAKELKTKGYSIIEEAATDIIASEQTNGNMEPWTQISFIDNIVNEQKQRQIQASGSGEIQFYDRSPICTYALSRYLGFSPSAGLLSEIDRIRRENIYQRKVFFIENLGFCTPTEARKISFEESLVFEKIHLEAYGSFGYDCITIPRGELPERVKKIMGSI